MAGALAGFRIVDLTSMISGPIATRILADQGADVLKVEAPGGGDLVRVMGAGRAGLSPTFVTANRNKRSVAIDLKSRQGVEILRRLVAGAEVFVQNFRPGTAERLGLDEHAVRTWKSDLVYVSISGFGEKGPYAHQRVYDPIVQALSGLADVQADRDTGRPRMMRLIVPDKVTALTAAQAITAALLARERTGAGQHVRLSMLDATVAFLWPEGMAAYTFVGEEGRGARPQLAQDLIFETADGYLTTGAVSDAEWESLARAADHTEWLEDPRFRTPGGRVRHAEARLALMAQAFRHRTTADWLARLDAVQVPCAPVLRRAEVVTHPQIVESALLVETDHPQVGSIREPRPAARFDRTPAALGRPAPLLGEHTDAVLAEIGFTMQEVAALRAEGVVA